MFILIICIGIVSAHENDTITLSDADNNPDTDNGPTADAGFDEVEKLIDNASENDVITLEAKRYNIDANESHVVINKDFTLEGSEGTIIDGNGHTLYFNTEIPAKDGDDINETKLKYGYEIQNTGKTITLKNITFANVEFYTWHGMNFIDCSFMNSTLTSLEMNNTFENCIFTDSTLEIANFLGMFPENCTPDHSKINSCNFYNSTVKSVEIELDTYVALVGSSIFQTINTIDISNSDLRKSNVKLTYYSININDCNFSDTDWLGYSLISSISSAAFDNLSASLFYSIFNAESVKLKDSHVEFLGGYYSRGCEILLEECEVNSSEVIIKEGMFSRNAHMNVTGSRLNSCRINSSQSEMSVRDSVLHKTAMDLLETNASFENSTLIADGKLTDVIKKNRSICTFENTYLINGSGKYELTEKDFEADIPSMIIYLKKEFYYVGDELAITLLNSKGEPVSNCSLTITDTATNESLKGYSDENGNVKYVLERAGELCLTAATDAIYDDDSAHVLVLQINITANPVPAPGDNIIDIINNAEDGVIILEGKIYYVEPKNGNVLITRDLSIEGHNGTVIDGNYSSLYLNAENRNNTKNIKYGLWKGGYEIKNTGKTIDFENITFKNINITTWHGMNFKNCNFINSTVTSYELNNTFKGCRFKNSTVEIMNFLGTFPENCTPDYSTIDGCGFSNSTVRSHEMKLTNYIEIVGGSRFEIINSIDISNSTFSESRLELNKYQVKIDGCSFANSGWAGYSSMLNVSSSRLNGHDMSFSYSIFNAKDSRLDSCSVEFSGAYFSIGCEINLNDCDVNNTEFKIEEGMNSRKSSLNVTNSNLNNSFVDSTYSDMLISDSALEKTDMRLLFTEAIFNNSTLISDENLSDIFKTYNSTLTFENSYLVNSSGKYEIKSEDIELNNLDEITVGEKEFYYVGDELTITLKDAKGNPIADSSMTITDLATSDAESMYTDENGTVKYLLQRGGNISLAASTGYGMTEFGRHIYSKFINLTVYSIPIDINVSSITTAYASKSKLKIQLSSNDTNSTLNGFKITVKIFTGKKWKTYEVETKSNGTAAFTIPKKLASGKHETVISTRDLISKNITITVKKAKTIVKSPEVTNKKYFKISVKNKATGKAVSKVKLKVRVYTGKKYKTFTVKTNKKGIAKLKTKSLKAGKHRVVISSGNKNYKISAKSAIKIKK